MNLYSGLQDALYNVTSTLLPNIPVIHSHGGGAEPRESYVSINILSVDRVGREYEQTFTSGVDSQQTTRSDYEATVRFLFIGSESGNIAYEFESNLHNNATRFVMYDNKLAVMRFGDVNRVPDKRDTTWVDYFTFDVVFSYAVVNEQPIDIIENVSWNTNNLL